MLSDQCSFLFTTVFLIPQPSFQSSAAVKAGLWQVIFNIYFFEGKGEYLPKIKTRRISILVSLLVNKDCD